MSENNNNISLEVPKSKVYIKIDENNNIIRCEGGYTTPDDLTGWIEIDSGYGDKYNLCQSNYFPKSLIDLNGICRYKYLDGNIIEKTSEQIQAEYVPPPEPLTIDDLAAAIQELAEVISNG